MAEVHRPHEQLLNVLGRIERSIRAQGVRSDERDLTGVDVQTDRRCRLDAEEEQSGRDHHRDGRSAQAREIPKNGQECHQEKAAPHRYADDPQFSIAGRVGPEDESVRFQPEFPLSCRRGEKMNTASDALRCCGPLRAAASMRGRFPSVRIAQHVGKQRRSGAPASKAYKRIRGSAAQFSLRAASPWVRSGLASRAESA